jgi:4-amino-4-deoxy-L-arabinose transferase-like glycosyltransferase
MKSNELPLRQTEKAILLAITVLALSLRFFRLDFQSFWSDEMQTATYAQQSLSFIFKFCLTRDLNPPLFYYLEKLLIQFFGLSDFVLRSSSAFFGGALVPLLYLCTRKLFNNTSALYVAIFATVSFPLVWFSQEARAYLMQIFFTYLAFFCYLNLGQRRIWTFGFFLSGLLALFSHYTAALFLAALFVDAGFRRNIKAMSIVALQGVLVSLWLYVGHQLRTNDYGNMDWIADKEMPTDLWGKFSILSEFFVKTQINPDISEYFGWAVLIMGVVLFRQVKALHRANLKTIILILFIPILFSSVLDLFRPFFYPKYFLQIVPAFLIFIVVLMNSLKQPWIKSLLIVGFLISQVYQVQSFFRVPFRAEIRQAVEFAKAHDPAAKIDTCTDYSKTLYNHYLKLDLNSKAVREAGQCEISVEEKRHWLMIFNTDDIHPNLKGYIRSRLIFEKRFHKVQLFYLGDKEEIQAATSRLNEAQVR